MYVAFHVNTVDPAALPTGLNESRFYDESLQHDLVVRCCHRKSNGCCQGGYNWCGSRWTRRSKDAASSPPRYNIFIPFLITFSTLCRAIVAMTVECLDLPICFRHTVQLRMNLAIMTTHRSNVRSRVFDLASPTVFPASLSFPLVGKTTGMLLRKARRSISLSWKAEIGLVDGFTLWITMQQVQDGQVNPSAEKLTWERGKCAPC